MTAKKERIIATMDTETDPFKYNRLPEPFTLGHYDGSGYYEFVGEKDKHPLTCVEQYIDYLDSLEPDEKERLIIYTHNGGKFDFFFFLDFIDNGSIVAINGRIVKCSISGVEFRDSFTIYPMALATYQKEKFNYERMEKENRYKPENFYDILKYQKSDCINLHKLVSAFTERFGDVLTVSSAAFKQLKLTGYEIKNTYKNYDETFRDYYYGGRTEVFKSGVFKSDVVYYDINSAYPYAMLNKHPSGNKIKISDKLPANNKMYFAEILAISKGALPFRDDKGFLCFPNDNEPRTYFVTSWEIEAGLKTNTLDIIKINKTIQHEQYQDFKPFVDKFYKEKLEAKLSGDKDSETFSKLMLNSCYGKFALDPTRYKHVEIARRGNLPDELINWFEHYNVVTTDELKDSIMMDIDISDFEAEQRKFITEYEMKMSHSKICIWERPDPNERFYNTATAASITGFVRAFMWETICNSEGVIYCDTDSVMCENFHGKKSNDLGDWKLECIFDELYVGGKKLYAGHIKDKKHNDENNWKTACKGSRLDYGQIIEIVRDNKAIKWCNDAPSFSLKNNPRFVDRTIQKTV